MGCAGKWDAWDAAFVKQSVMTRQYVQVLRGAVAGVRLQAAAGARQPLLPIGQLSPAARSVCHGWDDVPGGL